MIVGVCRLIANHLHLAFFESIPEVRVLPSTGITRLQRSYYPVRLPPMPPPEATLRPLPSHQRVSPDYPNHLSDVPCPLVWGFFCQASPQGAHLFSSSVSLFDLEPVSSPRPTNPRHCRAQGLSRLAVAPTLPRAPIIARPYLDGSEHDGTLGVVGMTYSRGAR